MQTFTKETVRDFLEEKDTNCGSRSQAAKDLGVVPQLLSMVILGQRPMSDELAIRILEDRFGADEWMFEKSPDVFTMVPKLKKK